MLWPVNLPYLSSVWLVLEQSNLLPIHLSPVSQSPEHSQLLHRGAIAASSLVILTHAYDNTSESKDGVGVG